jgi:short-subunit dehydrogenase
MNISLTAFIERYGPWAVVTGASDGIGRAFADQLAAKGMNLVLVARRAPLLAELARNLTDRHGVECHVLQLDLSNDEGTRTLIDCTDHLDVGLLVAAAGFGSSGPFLAANPRVEADMLAVNCSSVLTQCWHFGQRFAERGRGGVVLMSSLLAFNGSPLAANYAATKAYIQSLAEGLRREWSLHGIDVIASAPGPIDTGFAARANMRMGQALKPAVVARVTLSALGRQGTIRPGWLSKLLGWSLGTAPRALRVSIMGRIMAGMTAHQQRSVAH